MGAEDGICVGKGEGVSIGTGVDSGIKDCSEDESVSDFQKIDFDSKSLLAATTSSRLRESKSKSAKTFIAYLEVNLNDFILNTLS